MPPLRLHQAEASKVCVAVHTGDILAWSLCRVSVQKSCDLHPGTGGKPPSGRAVHTGCDAGLDQCARLLCCRAAVLLCCCVAQVPYWQINQIALPKLSMIRPTQHAHALAHAGKGHPEGFELGSLPHPKVVNSAYFMPMLMHMRVLTQARATLRALSWAACRIPRWSTAPTSRPAAPSC